MTFSAANLPMLALIALAVLLGHDTLMTTGPHHVSSAGHSVESSAEHGDASHTTPEPPCHVSEAMISAPAGPTSPLPSDAAGMPVPAADEWQSTDVVGWQAPPPKPPDVARALLQVFLN